MTPTDFRLLCTALGFTAVALNDNTPLSDNARRAACLAGLIEDYCRIAMPEAFAEMSADDKILS